MTTNTTKENISLWKIVIHCLNVAVWYELTRPLVKIPQCTNLTSHNVPFYNRNMHICAFLAATKQLYEWFSPSVRPSFRLSIRHTFLTMFPSAYHHEIFWSYYQWQKWRPCKRSRSKVKVTEVTTQLNGFLTATPVWIHIWWWNDAYSLIMLRRGALLFFKVIRQISRSHG